MCRKADVCKLGAQGQVADLQGLHFTEALAKSLDISQGGANKAPGKMEDAAGKALAVAVQVMLALKLNVREVSTGLGIPWLLDESLQEKVRETFPSEQMDEHTPSMTIKRGKLRARYLRDYAKVKLDWTNDLSDHLSLSTEEPKTLRIFRYVSLLEAAFARFNVQDIRIQPGEMLKMEE